MRQTKASDVTEVRCLVLRGLPVILGDDPSSFFKACFPLTPNDCGIVVMVGWGQRGPQQQIQIPISVSPQRS
ncbi:unnamed protein product [Arctogadus glacialis]